MKCILYGFTDVTNPLFLYQNSRRKKLLGWGLRPIRMRVVTSFLTLHHNHLHYRELSQRNILFDFIFDFLFVFRSVKKWYDLGSLTSTDKWVHLKNTHSLAAAFPGNLSFRKLFSSTHAWPAFLWLCAVWGSVKTKLTTVMTGSSEKRRSISKMESTSDDSEPSYAIVNKQLQDVIRFQHTVIARMKAKARNQWICFIS